MDLRHEERLSKVEARAESNTHRLDDVEKRQDNLDKLVASVSVLTTEMSTVKSDVGEIKSEIKNINGKSGKKWDNFWFDVLKIAAAAILGFLFAQIGIN